MAIDLRKGGRINLEKEIPSLKDIGIDLGWSVNENDGDFDLDASLFMVAKNGKVPQDGYFIFYNNLVSPDGAAVHHGDDRTGEDDGENIVIKLDKIDSSIEELIFVVTIHDADIRNQNFGKVKNAFIKIYDLDTDRDIVRYNLEENFSSEVSIEFGRIYKKGIFSKTWEFKATGKGSNAGLQGFVNRFV